MTLREWVMASNMGSYALREAFETAVLSGAAWWAAQGLPQMPDFGTADTVSDVWDQTFAMWHFCMYGIEPVQMDSLDVH